MGAALKRRKGTLGQSSSVVCLTAHGRLRVQRLLMETGGPRSRPATVSECSCGPDYVHTLAKTLSTSAEIRSQPH